MEDFTKINFKTFKNICCNRGLTMCFHKKNYQKECDKKKCPEWIELKKVSLKGKC
jgi:hypothetical protein